MRRLGALATIAALAVMAWPVPALAGPLPAGACSNGVMAAGTYRTFVVRGTCAIARGATVSVRGDLILTPGASLDDHGAEQWTGAQVHVSGDVLVGRGAVLALGWNSPGGDGTLGPDTVGGSILAYRPLALQIGGVTIGGSLVSLGGGVSSTSAADFRNFPVKDNVIGGSLVVEGWHGGWLGVIRNTVRGDAIIAFNVSSSGPGGPGVDTDSTEVMGSQFGPVQVPQSIGGNLVCFGNVPAAQVNPSDGGAPNVVGGRAYGQCRGLTQ